MPGPPLSPPRSLLPALCSPGHGAEQGAPQAGWLLALICQCPAGSGGSTAGGQGSWRMAAREGRPHARSSRGTAEGTFSKDTQGQQDPEGLGWHQPPAKGFTRGWGGEEVETACALSLGHEPRAGVWPGSPSAQLGITQSTVAAQGPRGGLGEGQVRIHGPGEEELFTSPIHTGQLGAGGGCQPSPA